MTGCQNPQTAAAPRPVCRSRQRKRETPHARRKRLRPAGRITRPRTRRPITPWTPRHPRLPHGGAPCAATPWLRVAVVASLAAGGYFLIPYVETALNTVSTDDAYVNGHVTLVAPRVSGLVSRVLVDDNYRVSKGDLLVQLDKEPYQVQVDIKKAAVVNAEADLEVAEVPGARHQSSCRPSGERWKASEGK